MNKSDWNIRKRLRSFSYAFNGIGLIFHQPNACIHAVVMLIVIGCGIYFEISQWKWVAVILCIGAVLMAEAFNTAIEVLADRISSQYDPMIGKAKDIAAGAVLLIVLAVVIVGLIILLPEFIGLFID